MKDTLRPGIGSEFTFRIPESKTVPALYPESTEFQEMPEVFATGFMVGFLEWACIKAINPYLDWPGEQTVGTHINVSHIAATPIGFEVTAKENLLRLMDDGWYLRWRHMMALISSQKEYTSGI